MTKKVQYAVKMLLFVLMVACLWRMLEYVLIKPKDPRWYSEGLKNVYKKDDNYYDFLIAGTSVAIASTNSQELYHEYGIASTSIGEPQQFTVLSYYAIKEALNYQNPQAILFDVKSLFYSKDQICRQIRKDENSYLHFTLDNIKDLKIKYEAFRTIKEDFVPEIDFWEYFCPMYYGHSYWESLSEESFVHGFFDDILGGNKLLLRFSPKQRKKEVFEIDNNGDKAVIPACNKKYLIKIIELCKEKGIDLILLSGYSSIEWKWDRYNAVKEIADEYGLQYLNINILEKQIGMDWNTDNADNVHLNLSGAEKWMEYIGDYLKNNYVIPDHRLDKRYSEFEENEKVYLNMVKAMDAMKKLFLAENFKDYLTKLTELNRKGYAIFLACSDDMTKSLDDEGRELLKQLGIEKDLNKKFRYSFLAVIDDGEVVTQKLSKQTVTAEAALNNGKNFQLISGGKMSGKDASLILDDAEQMKNGRGINIVVYDKEADVVLSSVYFDTCGEANPAPKK